MSQPIGLVEKRKVKRAGERRFTPSYRAVTLGREREEWAVIDGEGAIVFRGEARVAAMVASRLTRPGE